MFDASSPFEGVDQPPGEEFDYPIAEEEEVDPIDLLSKTPPMTQRFMRRARSKTNQNHRPPSSHQKLPSSHSSPNLGNYSSSAVNSLKAKHDKKMQQIKLDRSAMRSLKHSSLSFEHPDTQRALSPADSGPPPSPLVDTTKQYRSLASHQVGSSEQRPGPHPSPKKHSASGHVYKEDRIRFHRTFALLIKMGNKGNEDAKVGDVQRKEDGDFHRFQTRWPEVLWLELQAYFNMIPIESQDSLLIEARESIYDVYREVMDFKLVDLTHQENRTNAKPCALRTRHRKSESCDCSSSSNKLEDFSNRRSRLESNSSHRSLCLPLNDAMSSYIHSTKEAWTAISSLLKRLELIEALYPTTKALIVENPDMGRRDFVARVHVLQLWMNLTREIDQKLSLAGEALGVEDQDIWWPHIGCRDCSPMGGNDDDNNQGNVEVLGTGEEVGPEVNGPNVTCEVEAEEGSSTPDVSPIKGVLVQGRSQGGPVLKHQRSVTFSCGGESDEEEDETAERPRLEGIDDLLEEGEVSEDTFSGPTSPVSSTPSKEGDSPRVNRIFSDCHFSFDYDSLTSIYRPFVDSNLKHSGLRKMNSRLHQMLGQTILKIKLALEKPSDDIEKAEYARGISLSESSASLSTMGLWEAEIKADDSLSVYGAWNPDFQKMGLPTYFPIFLFLVRIPVDVMHECLRFRLEHKPTAEPSLHSVQQLLNECKEVLRAAVEVKSYYQKMVSSLARESVGTLEHMDSDIDDYENDMEDMLQHYFEYLHSWMQMLQKLPQASISLKNNLMVEWNFAKEACPSIRGGEAQAGKRFCIMASSLFESISEFLENGVDDICTQFQDSHSLDDSNVDKESRHHLRKLVIEIRDRLSKALSFSKMFARDLEIAAEFQCTESESCLLAALHRTGHIRVKTVDLPNHWVFVPGSIKNNSAVIHSLLDDLCSHERAIDSPHAASTMAHDGYMLLMKAPCRADRRSKWPGEEIEVVLNVEVTIQLSDIQVNSVLLVVNHSSLLLEQRRVFKKAVGNVIYLVNENTSSHGTIAQALKQLKMNALNICSHVTEAINKVKKDYVQTNGSLSRMKDTLDLFYSVGFEYHKEVERLVSGSERTEHAARSLVLARQWMAYVFDNCERGRGKRPRWASQGLDFLSLVLEPKKVASLDDTDYEDLKNTISRCIGHLIGDPDSRPASPTFPEAPSELLHPSRSISKSSRSSDSSLSPIPTRDSLSRTNSADWAMGSSPSPSSFPLPIPGSAPELLQRNPSLLLDVRSGRRSRKIRKRLEEMERRQDENRRRKRQIGVVRGDTAPSPVISISCKKVTFKWQRGFKIGDGQFGTTVYSCINMDNGETLAVKEIRFQRNDQSTIKNIADEIHYLEGIAHPNLVRYYGVELHREELLVFMEYCDEGTLSEAAKNGLPEGLIRQYLREICTAISVLHSNNIIHRDIKGANIFLHSDGHVKLGDFGAAIKLKKHQTILGEVNEVMGTVAFMAPEIITNSAKDGYGRAADIWSLGCVVIEMASGKRPWHEYDNNYAIMYIVGGGGTPGIPDNYLTREGHDFLSHCLQQDAKQRWSADQLLEHPFVKVTKVFPENDAKPELPKTPTAITVTS